MKDTNGMAYERSIKKKKKKKSVCTGGTLSNSDGVKMKKKKTKLTDACNSYVTDNIPAEIPKEIVLATDDQTAQASVFTDDASAKKYKNAYDMKDTNVMACEKSIKKKKKKKNKTLDASDSFATGDIATKIPKKSVLASCQNAEASVFTVDTGAKKRKNKRKGGPNNTEDEVVTFADKLDNDTAQQVGRENGDESGILQNNKCATDSNPPEKKRKLGKTVMATSFTEDISNISKNARKSLQKVILEQKEKMSEQEHAICDKISKGKCKKSKKIKSKKTHLSRKNKGHAPTLSENQKNSNETALPEGLDAESVTGPVIPTAHKNGVIKSDFADVTKLNGSLKRKLGGKETPGDPTRKKKETGRGELSKLSEEGKTETESNEATDPGKKYKLKTKKRKSDKLKMEDVPVVSGANNCKPGGHDNPEDQKEKNISCNLSKKPKANKKDKKTGRLVEESINSPAKAQSTVCYTKSRKSSKKKMKSSRSSDDGSQTNLLDQATETDVTAENNKSPCKTEAKSKSKKKKRLQSCENDERMHAKRSPKPKVVGADGKYNFQCDSSESASAKVEGVLTKVDVGKRAKGSVWQPTKSKLGQWQTAQLSNSTQQNKFIRLMGGAKNTKNTDSFENNAGGQSVLSRLSGVWKPPPGRKLFGSLQSREKKTFSSMALCAEDSETLTTKLEGQYNETLKFNLQKRKEGNIAKGLGFKEDPAKGKNHYIDVHKVNSVALD